MDQEKLARRIDQIEEQARLTLAEWPVTLAKERQRMIVALVRSIRLELSISGSGDPVVDALDPERTVEGPH